MVCEKLETRTCAQHAEKTSLEVNLDLLAQPSSQPAIIIIYEKSCTANGHIIEVTEREMKSDTLPSHNPIYSRDRLLQNFQKQMIYPETTGI